tara:strand:+ start:536 stop:1534 length:999 start_codon:yes stop_codon:yes gene_type:complete
MAFKLSDNFGPLRKNWIKGAIKRPGAFKAKAEKAGESTKEYAKQVTDNPKSYDSRTVKQAHLAETLMGMNMNESPANMHTDKHMRRQAEKKAKKTQGDAQDIYYEMKSQKMEKEKKKSSPANLGAADAKSKSGDSNIKTEKLDEVVVTAKKDRSREAIKNRKAKDKKEGKSKREIRLAKTKDKAKAAKQATVDAKDKESQATSRAKANRLAKRVARQEGRAERRENRKSKKFRENKRQTAIKSRRQQKEKAAKGASALALKKGSPAKGYKSDAQRKAVHASKADGGKGAPSKLKKDSPAEANKFMAALQAAKDKGEKSFVVNGKNYNVTSKK